MNKKIRWVGQNDNFRCGPVAIVNILKWAGVKEWYKQAVNSKMVSNLASSLLKTNSEGTLEKDMKRVLKKNINRIKVKRKSPSLSVIKKHLKNDGIILLDHDAYLLRENKYIPHYALIVQVNKHENLYKIVNNAEDCPRIGIGPYGSFTRTFNTVHWIHKRDLVKILRRVKTMLTLIKKND